MFVTAYLLTTYLPYLILITIPTNDAQLLYLLHNLYSSLLAYLFATYLRKYFLLYPLAYILSYLLTVPTCISDLLIMYSHHVSAGMPQKKHNVDGR